MFVIHAANPVMTFLLVLSALTGLVTAGVSVRAAKPSLSTLTAHWFGLAALAAIWLFFVPLNIWSTLAHHPIVWMFGSEVVDGGTVENLTVLFYLLAIGAALILMPSAGRLYGAQAAPLWRIILMMVVIGSIVMIGEEISWGQNWLGFATPDQLNKINLQHEANVHNLVSPRLYDEMYQGLGWVMILAPLWAHYAAGTLQRLSPIRFLAECFLTPATYGLMVSAGIVLQHEVFEELSEMVLAMAVFQAMLMVVIRARQPVDRNKAQTTMRTAPDRSA